MSYFLAILGSPSKLSRNSFLLHGLEKRSEPHQKTPFRTTHAVELQPFAPGASDRLTDLISRVRAAQAILLITPVPSEDWSGCMKSLLQFLPAGAFEHRPILLIGTGGFVNELADLEKSLDHELDRLNGRLSRHRSISGQRTGCSRLTNRRGSRPKRNSDSPEPWSN